MSRPAPSAAAAALIGGLLAWSAAACAPPDLAGPVASGPAAGGDAAPVALPTALPDDTGWEAVAPGIERRGLAVRDAAGRALDRMLIVRLDPTAVRFDVGYAPGAPRDLAAWQAETGALLVINGGFFTEGYEATGLVVSRGTAHGQSYGPFAGMFAVTEAGPDVRWLGSRPYDPTEPLVAALQAFPMLVLPGGSAGVAPSDAGPDTARRTWIGQDAQGRVLAGVAPTGGLTLADLSAWLASADLELDRALNLDGGGSTGLLLDAGDGGTVVAAFDRLPTVILAFAR